MDADTGQFEVHVVKKILYDAIAAVLAYTASAAAMVYRSGSNLTSNRS